MVKKYVASFPKSKKLSFDDLNMSLNRISDRSRSPYYPKSPANPPPTAGIPILEISKIMSLLIQCLKKLKPFFPKSFRYINSEISVRAKMMPLFG